MALLGCVIVSGASAAEFSAQSLGNDAALVVIDGEIKVGDAKRFDAIIQPFSKGAVLLRSPGGSLMDGIAIGETIRMKALGTGVAPDTMCASACALAWLGGTQRFMSVDARVGFHLAYRLDDDGRAQETGFGNALMGAYLTRLGLPTRAVAYIAGAGPAEMTWLTAADAERVGIDVSLLDLGEAPMDEATAAPVPSAPLAAPSKPASHYVDGLDPSGDNWLALKAAPNVKSKRLRKMGPGTRLQVLNQSGNWLRVRLDDGAEGWAYSKYVACCVTG